MITKNQNGIEWGNLLVIVLFFSVSWVVFRNPLETLMTLGLMYGIVALVEGVIGLILFKNFKEFYTRSAWIILLVSIVEGLIGVYFIMRPQISLAYFPIVFSLWIILDSIRNITWAYRLQHVNKRWF